MTNKILYISSLILAIVHYIVAYLYYNPKKNILLLVISFGLITSIINHKVTCHYAKIIDRIMMIIGFIYNLFIISNILNSVFMQNLCYLLLLLSVLLYLLNKKYILNNKSKNIYSLDILHVLSHFILTINHIILMIY